MARLLHHFTPLFSYGLALDEKVSANQASEPAPSVIACCSAALAAPEPNAFSISTWGMYRMIASMM